MASALLFCNALAAASFLWVNDASAATSVTVVPAAGLNNGDKVDVSGSGFAAGIGAITQCNDDPAAPTILVAGVLQVSVGCSDPTGVLVNFDNAGALAATKFTVKTGKIGPPAAGQDSAGHDAATDAADYPCPPTAAQINKGVTCVIGLGDLAGHTGKSPITFAGQAVPTTTTTAAPTTTTTAKPATTTTTAAAGATTTTVVSTTSTTVAAGVTTTSTTLASSVLGTQTTKPSSSGGALPRTGLPRHLVLMAVIGVAVLDLGYLLESSTRPARRLRERLSRHWTRG